MSRSRGASSFTRSPPMISSPSEISSRPATIRSAVDFPQPDGLTRLMDSPSPISRFMSLTASKPSGYRFQMFLNVISAIYRTPPARRPPSWIVELVCLVTCPGVTVARPWREDEQQARAAAPAHRVALAGIEARREARATGLPAELHLAVHDDH